MRDNLPPYPGDSDKLSRFRSDRTPFFVVEADPALSVVLGCGTPTQPDVNAAACDCDDVPVFRRKGGGGAVLLGPGCLIVTGCLHPAPGRFPEVWSRLISEALCDAITSLGVPGVVTRGLGDLCVAPSSDAPERKFLGSSLYVAKDVVLYQASLLRTMDLSLIPRYLGAPSRQPQYRQGRDHLDFVTNLPSSSDWAPIDLEAELNRYFDRF